MHIKSIWWIILLLITSLIAVPVYAQETPAFTVTLNAIGVTQRTMDFDWTASISAPATALTIDADASETTNFNMIFTRETGTVTDRYTVTGQICVTNNRDDNLSPLAIDHVLAQDNTPVLITAVNTNLAPVIGPGQTQCYPYTATYQPQILPETLAITSYATVRAQEDTQPDVHSEAIAVNLSNVNLTTTDEAARVQAALTCPAGFTCTPATFGPLTLYGSMTLPFTVTITNVEADCNQSHTLLGTATAEEDNSGVVRQSNHPITLSCESTPITGSLLTSTYLDADSNAAYTEGELLLSQRMTELRDATGTTLLSSQATDVTGTTLYTMLQAGNYTICQVLPEGWMTLADTNCQPVVITPGETAQATFGSRQPVEPVALCYLATDTQTATHFGYINPNPVAITIPAGEHNNISAGQPLLNFATGSATNWPQAPLIINAADDVTWLLDGLTVSTPDNPCAYRITLEKTWLEADSTVLEPPFELDLSSMQIEASSTLGTATCGYVGQLWQCTYNNTANVPDNQGLWVAAGDTYSVSEPTLPYLWEPTPDSIGEAFQPESICIQAALCTHTVRNVKTVPTSPPGVSYTPR